jgi:hypothetical protein
MWETLISFSQLENYSYRNVFLARSEGRFPEDEVAVEIIGKRGPIQTNLKDNLEFLIFGSEAEIFKSTSMSIIDLHDGALTVVKTLDNATWLKLNGRSGWVDPDFSTGTSWTLWPSVDFQNFYEDLGFRRTLSYLLNGSDPDQVFPAVTRDESIRGRPAVYRCWVANLGQWFHGGGLMRATPGLADSVVHLWTDAADGQLVQFAVEGTHDADLLFLGSGQSELDATPHDPARELIYYFEVTEIGIPFAVEVDPEAVPLLSLPPSGTIADGAEATPADELPAPPGATRITGPFPVPGTGDPQYPLLSAEYPPASNYVVQENLVGFLGPNWHTWPAENLDVFETASPPLDAALYYQAELESRGWTLLHFSAYTGQTRIVLVFQQDLVILPVLIEQTGPATRVIAFYPSTLNTQILESARVFYPSNSELNGREITALGVAPSGDIWVGTFSDGIFIWEGGTWITLTAEKSGLCDDEIVDFVFDAQGRTWIAVGAGCINVLENDQWTTYTDLDFGLSLYLEEITVDAGGRIWVAALDGVSVFDGQGWQAWNYQEDIGFERASFIHAIAIDAEGNVWAVSDKGGIGIYNGLSWKILVSESSGQFERLWDVLIDESGRTWFAAENGLHVLEGDEWRRFDEANTELGLSKVRFLTEDEFGRLWIATGIGGLYSLEADGVWSSYLHLGIHLALTDLFPILLAGPDGRIWIANCCGLASFLPLGR